MVATSDLFVYDVNYHYYVGYICSVPRGASPEPGVRPDYRDDRTRLDYLFTI